MKNSSPATEPISLPKGRKKDLTLDIIYGEPGFMGNDISQVEWSPDGRLLTYTFGRKNHNQLIAYEPATKRRRILFDYARILPKNSTSERQWFWDADGELLPWRLRASDMIGVMTYGYVWAPDGKSMLVYPSDDGPYYLLDVATGALSAALPIPVEADDVDYSPDGSFLSYVLNYNIVVYHLASGQTVYITQTGTEARPYATPDTLGDFLSDGYWWSPDSTRIAYLASDESAVESFPLQDSTSFTGTIDPERFPMPGQSVPQMGLWVVGPHGTCWINPGPYVAYYLARVQWLPDSRRLALQLVNRQQNHLVLLIVDAETGQYYPVLEERDPCWINLSEDLTFLGDGSVFLWSSERQSYRHLYLYSLDGRQLVQLTKGDLPSVNVKVVDEKAGHVYFKTFPKPYVDGHLMRVSYKAGPNGYTAGEVESLTTVPGVHTVTLSPDCKYFADFHSTAVIPPHLHLYSCDGEMISTIEENPAPETGDYLAPVEFLPLLPAAKVNHRSDKFGLCHRILKPRDMRPGKKYPAIVYVYGGPAPGGTSRTVMNKWLYLPDMWLQMMAQKGYVVYSVDNRGSCEAPRGHDFETAIYRQFGKVELADQLEGVKYLKSLPFVDPSRIGIFGGSFGGFMVLNAMLRAPNVFKAAVSFAPVTDWLGYDSIYTEQYMDLPDQNQKGYRDTQLPPLAENLKGKLMLLHGTSDMNVHLPHSFRLIADFQVAGLDFDLMLYPEQGHLLFFETTPIAKTLFARITRFFEENL